MALWKKVILGLILGILAGHWLGDQAIYLKPIGTVFLRAVQMIVTPMIFFSLVSGITSMSDPGSLGRVGIKATIAFLTTTFFAVIFGMTVAIILRPGEGTNVHFGTDIAAIKPTKFDIVEFFINIVPDNIIKAFASGSVLQVVFFSIFTGIVINQMGNTAQAIKDSVQLMSKLVLKMIGVIIQFSPYATFALTAWVISTQGGDIISGLIKLVISVVMAMLLQYLIFGLMILVFCRISPIPFYKKSIEYQVMAFSTSSSKAALATTMSVCKDRLGISESSTSFVLPLGASINMDGFAINLSLTTVFFAQILGVDLHFYDYMVIIFTATLGSIGGAGIPGASLIMLPMVLASVNLPIEGVAILAGVDRILDMLRTTINITGDATITLMIDHSEGSLDLDKYNSDQI